MLQFSRKIQKGMVITAVALVSILNAELTLAQFPGFEGRGGHRRGFGGRGMMGDMMAEYLGLTDAQQADAKAIRQAAREQSQPIREQLRTNRQALGDAIKAGDMIQIDTLAAQQGRLQGQLIGIRAKSQVELSNLLTVEQQEKKRQFEEKRKARHKEHKNRRQQMRERFRGSPRADQP